MQRRYDAVFLIGRPGCGKGTQSRLLQRRAGFALVKTGTLFRALAKKQTTLGRNVKKTLNRGKLMPPWLAFSVVLDASGRVDAKKPVLFDGSPRTKREAEWLTAALPWFGRNHIAAVHLFIRPQESYRRLILRKRHDDTPVVIRARLQEFDRNVMAALRVLREKRLLKTVKGERPIQEVARDIRRVLHLT
ncbi:MAG: hypothetical protein A2806_04600 [Candidatus Terrybacteria bacterium RIFCSPHIGHO2_01_FULL_48_17]|uniref:Adenylate kinase n=1 Tax=Candidatus Terrybacteria bacterium RIFCSPHIGHO2_01_FULL_48_17 TaxID=1802362 RepID=A0A1G2PKZ6_9BACT|nr:MAG: hypothetical protein A2806_04600 [Candidatus Terrybacteria bacterium RIFCSPHIGHO2_01_FULL_48_17]OHA52825.1 MAG: hypothetical protein A3A30_02925 [Candidatus Terrybacteria bacterium RIFCSPLOWO2_01_FULL_48_14]